MFIRMTHMTHNDAISLRGGFLMEGYEKVVIWKRATWSVMCVIAIIEPWQKGGER